VEHRLRWRMRKHVLLFAVGTFVGSFLPVLLAPITSWLGMTAVNEEQTILKYGGTAMLLNCLFFGTLFFSIGAALAKRFFNEPAQWSSVVVGGIYSAVVFMLALFVPMERGSVSGILFAMWLILFPGLAVAASSLFLKRSNRPLDGDARQAGAR
jgi:hypothetical protein